MRQSGGVLRRRTEQVTDSGPRGAGHACVFFVLGFVEFKLRDGVGPTPVQCEYMGSAT